MKWYSTFQICDELGIEKGRFRQWLNEGFIKPTVKAHGKGTRAVFSETDLKLIKEFRRLVDLGYHRKAAARIILSSKT